MPTALVSCVWFVPGQRLLESLQCNVEFGFKSHCGQRMVKERGSAYRKASSPATVWVGIYGTCCGSERAVVCSGEGGVGLRGPAPAVFPGGLGAGIGNPQGHSAAGNFLQGGGNS